MQVLFTFLLDGEIWISSIKHQKSFRHVSWKHKRLNGAENWLLYVR